MELMNAEKQRKEKKEFEQAKMDLVGPLNLRYCLTYHALESVVLWDLYNSLFKDILGKGFFHALCLC